MVTFTAAIEYTRNGSEFTENCSRAPAWLFGGGLTVRSTSSPHVATSPSSNPVNVSPEEAFVAALSSGHMRCFLEIAALFGFVVEQYSDTPKGSVATNSAGALCVAQVTLQPAILFSGIKVPTDAVVLALHQAAHAKCSLANSVSTVVDTLGVWHHEPSADSD